VFEGWTGGGLLFGDSALVPASFFADVGFRAHAQNTKNTDNNRSVWKFRCPMSLTYCVGKSGLPPSLLPTLSLFIRSVGPQQVLFCFLHSSALQYTAHSPPSHLTTDRKILPSEEECCRKRRQGREGVSINSHNKWLSTCLMPYLCMQSSLEKRPTEAKKNNEKLNVLWWSDSCRMPIS